MKTLRNPYILRPDQIQSGDVIAITVTIHVNRLDSHGYPLVRAYRCPYPNPPLSMLDSIPQGDQIDLDLTLQLVEALAPVLIWAGAKVDR